MIVTVTPNPAIDITYHLAGLEPGQVNRIDQVRERPGGKGINVARVLHQLGERVVATGLSGGRGGSTLAAALVDAGIPVDFVEVLPEIRRTVVVHEQDGTTTSLWEPGWSPADPAAAADALTGRIGNLLERARAVVISGSLPKGLDPRLPTRIASAAAVAGVPVVVDVNGEALSLAAGTGGAVLAPNSEEAAAMFGGTNQGTPDAIVHAVRRLVGRHGRIPAVILTLGADGIVAVLPTGALIARPPEVVNGNPTGAGDAVSAALARHLAVAGSYTGVDWRAALADAVALSASAVRRPVAGEIDRDAYLAWRDEITVEELCP